jgi:hypothetical protein
MTLKGMPVSPKAHNEALFEALRSLARARVPFVAIGTAALALRHPDLRAAYTLPDADVLLDPGLRGALPFARALHEEGFAITSWGTPFLLDDDPAILAGRWYLRATRGGLLVDGTYECVALDPVPFLSSPDWIEGIPVAAPRCVWGLKRAKDPDAAGAFSVRWGLAIVE